METTMATRKPFRSLDAFTRQYINTALWAENDQKDENTGGEPLDSNYTPRDIDDETYAQMIADCEQFQRENADDIALAVEQYPKRNNDDTGPLGTAGHDFWLTRGNHGCGFWDGDLSKDLGERLTKASHGFSEVNLYVGDNEKVCSF